MLGARFPATLTKISRKNHIHHEIFEVLLLFSPTEGVLMKPFKIITAVGNLRNLQIYGLDYTAFD